jgi:ATP-dependent DNA helicase RecG
MKDYGYVEDVGMGIPRKMIRGMKAHNGTDVGLVERDEAFIVTLIAA